MKIINNKLKFLVNLEGHHVQIEMLGGSLRLHANIWAVIRSSAVWAMPENFAGITLWNIAAHQIRCFMMFWQWVKISHHCCGHSWISMLRACSARSWLEADGVQEHAHIGLSSSAIMFFLAFHFFRLNHASLYQALYVPADLPVGSVGAWAHGRWNQNAEGHEGSEEGKQEFKIILTSARFCVCQAHANVLEQSENEIRKSHISWSMTQQIWKT